MSSQVCPQCGQVVEDSTARFCDIDGSPLRPKTQVSPVAPPRRGAGHGVTALLAGGGLVMLLASLWVLGGIGGPEELGEISLDLGLEEIALDPPESVTAALRRCYGEEIPGLPSVQGERVNDLYNQTKEVLRMGSAMGSSTRPITMEEEERYGQEVEDSLLKAHSPSQEKVPRVRLERLANRLIPFAPRHTELTYQFTLLDSDVVNALMGPGGRSFFFQGLLDAMPNDDHLAFVIGHELAHSELKHSTQSLSLALMGRDLGRAALGEEFGDLSGLITSVGLRFLSSTYDQDLEFEADRLGICLAYLSGAKPDAGVGATAIFGDIRKETAPGGGAKRVAYDIITSHPPARERHSYQNDLARTIEARGVR